MGQLPEGTEEETTLEDAIEQGEQFADEFASPDSEDFDKEILNESIEETIERSKKALESKAEEVNSGKENDGGKDPKKSENSGSGEGTAEQAVQSQSGGLEPPSRVSPEFREWYKTAPPEMQGEFNRAIEHLEQGQRNWLRQKGQEIHEYRQTVEPIFQAVQPWAKEWQTRGISLPQGVALLAKTHERMVENPAQEIARLISDNEVTLDEVEQHLNGTAANGGGNGSGMGYNFDISKHPEFQSLRNELETFKSERQEAQVKSETDKIRALRDEVDASGNRPYEHILRDDFLNYAQSLVTALRTPPRGPDGKFTGGPAMGLVDAYKKAYKVWVSEMGIQPETQAASHQPLNTQPQRKPAEPVSMRSRSAPTATPLMDDDPSKYRNESVEDTMNRVLAQMRG